MMRICFGHGVRARVLLLLAAFGFAFCPGLSAQPLSIAGNNSFMPFSYLDDSGKPTGIAVIVLRALLSESGIDDTIELYPLQRAMNMAEGPNTLCFAIFRTHEREAKYKWVVPLTLPVRSVLLKLKSRTDIRINTLEDAKKYSIGVVDGNNLHTRLLNAGFARSALQPVTTNELNYRKLFAGRVDLMVVRETSVKTEMKKLGFSAADTEVAYPLADDGPAWLAASLRTPDSVVIRIQTAYQQMGKDVLINKVTENFMKQFN